MWPETSKKESHKWRKCSDKHSRITCSGTGRTITFYTIVWAVSYADKNVEQSLPRAGEIQISYAEKTIPGLRMPVVVLT